MTAPIILLNLSLVCLCPVVLFGDISGARNVIPSLLAPDPLPSLPLLGGFLQLHPEFARDCQPRSPWVPHVAVALVAGVASAEALVPKDLPEFHRWWSNTPPPAPLQKRNITDSTLPPRPSWVHPGFLHPCSVHLGFVGPVPKVPQYHMHMAIFRD